ncbi:hypothetical protein ACGFIF_02415 [Kribbella sp. NPDC049174]|uniref:hypothetical protein n=1 Tax=Kribbella sp. NPDC049174 TaxID=3364112 RepID=UPI00370FD37D
MSKFLGFLLGVVVALAGPAVFGVLAAPGGIELNTKEMALAYGIGALIFWTVVSYFSGAGALGAFVAFGTLIYCWLWIPNRTTNFLNDVPGVTTGMIEGSKQYTLNGVVPILTVISLVYGIQLIVHSAQRRRRERVEAERLQGEQEAAQAQQEAEAAALYPVAGSTYPAEGGAYAGAYGNSNRYDDLFDEDPEPVRPRNQAEEQTAQFPVSTPEPTAQFPGVDGADDDARGNDSGDDTVLVPTDRDETTQVPVGSDETVQAHAVAEEQEQATVGADEQTVAAAADAEEQKAEQPTERQQEQPVAAVAAPGGAEEQPTAVVPVAAEEQKPAEPQALVAEADEQQDAAGAADERKPEQPGAGVDEEETVVAPGGAGQSAGGVQAGQSAGDVQAGQSATGAPAGQPAGGVPAGGAPAGPSASGVPAGQSAGGAQGGSPVGAADEATVVAPVPEPEQVDEPRPEKKGADGGQQAVAGPVTEVKGQAAAAKEQVGQQYRERMEDPEDTGEFYISAFENPTQVSIRPAGA